MKSGSAAEDRGRTFEVRDFVLAEPAFFLDSRQHGPSCCPTQRPASQPLYPPA